VKGSFGEFMDAALREAARTGNAWGVGALAGFSMGAGTFCCESIAIKDAAVSRFNLPIRA
jgi:hypothetical protein